MNHIDSSTISALENIHPISAVVQDKIMCALADELFECEYRQNYFAVFFPSSSERNIEVECAYIWLEKRDISYAWRWAVALTPLQMFWYIVFSDTKSNCVSPDVACKRLEALLDKLFDELGENR